MSKQWCLKPFDCVPVELIKASKRDATYALLDSASGLNKNCVSILRILRFSDGRPSGDILGEVFGIME